MVPVRRGVREAGPGALASVDAGGSGGVGRKPGVRRQAGPQASSREEMWFESSVFPLKALERPTGKQM